MGSRELSPIIFMKASRSAFLMMVFSAIGFMVGTGILVTDDPLRSLCQKGCWLNYFLYALFGEQGSKTALGVLWYSAAGLCLVFALKLRMKSARKSRSVGRQ